ncbi:hypothetical protein T4E_2069 [Trichinella pseudospiralis]|uniref:Uncharacterized protein n=1 Tax=Trichinella pseudospiralis TaxID=6337 RepID=A0A0V0XZT2_TRIPS|nr:hypothetical protein T4E_2069 [Trichinella pseudospiralis]
MSTVQLPLAGETVSRTMTLHFAKISKKTMGASYFVISLRITQDGKPHTISKSLVLPAIKDAVRIHFEEKV